MNGTKMKALVLALIFVFCIITTPFLVKTENIHQDSSSEVSFEPALIPPENGRDIPELKAIITSILADGDRKQNHPFFSEPSMLDIHDYRFIRLAIICELISDVALLQEASGGNLTEGFGPMFFYIAGPDCGNENFIITFTDERYKSLIDLILEFSGIDYDEVKIKIGPPFEHLVVILSEEQQMNEALTLSRYHLDMVQAAFDDVVPLSMNRMGNEISTQDMLSCFELMCEFVGTLLTPVYDAIGEIVKQIIVSSNQNSKLVSTTIETRIYVNHE